MSAPQTTEPDYGTDEKRLSIYMFGFIICLLLTLFSFWLVDNSSINRLDKFFILYSSAFIQFIVQLICFLRLNTKTEQSKLNVISLVFTGVILISIIIGTLWIMWNLNYNMMH